MRRQYITIMLLVLVSTHAFSATSTPSVYKTTVTKVELCSSSACSDPIVLGLISVIIIAPIAEEFLFRGFLFSQLKRTQLGGWGAVTLSSFLWTIIHFQYEPLILLVLFIFGIFLGYIRMAYNSLSLPIVLHAINNTFAFGMAYFFY